MSEERSALVFSLCRFLAACPCHGRTPITAALPMYQNPSDNQIGTKRADRLAGVLPQCSARSHLDLHRDQIGAQGTHLVEAMTSVLRWIERAQLVIRRN